MKEHYTDTIFYQIELTAKYCKMLGQQVFESFNAEISVDEFVVLDMIMCNENMCQRDLAKLIFRDRANTGKILDSLEKKEYIIRELSIKNNRPVKLIKITDFGAKIVEDTAQKIKPHYIKVKEKINNSDISHVGDLLAQLRNTLNDTLKIHI